MMKTSQNDLHALNQRMSILSERLRKSKIKSRGAPLVSGDDDRTSSNTTTSTIPQVIDMSPPAIQMRYESQQFPSSSSTTTYETCEETAITCSKNSHGKDSTSSPVKFNSLKSSLYNAETPRRDNISTKNDVSNELMNQDAACITPPTPNSNKIHDSDYDVTASPEIDIDNKTDDEESLLDSILNEEMDHLISIDGIHDYEDVQESVTAKEEDDYSSLLSQSSTEYDNEKTSSRNKEYEIDLTGRKISIENRMAMIREKVMRLKNQTTGLDIDSPIESTTNQNTLQNSFMNTESDMKKRLNEVLKRVTEVQKENEMLKEMNKRLIATLEMHGLSVLDDPKLKNDQILDMPSPKSNAIDEAKRDEGVSLNTKEPRKKDDDTTFKIKTQDEEFQYLFNELVRLQNRETQSLISYTNDSCQEDMKTHVDSSNGLEEILHEKLPALRVDSSEELQDLVRKSSQQRMIMSSLEKQIKDENFSDVNLESYIRALNRTIMAADHEHEPKQKHSMEVADTHDALHRVDVHQSAEIGGDDEELESLTESEKEKLRRDIEEERRVLMDEENKL